MTKGELLLIARSLNLTLSAEQSESDLRGAIRKRKKELIKELNRQVCHHLSWDGVQIIRSTSPKERKKIKALEGGVKRVSAFYHCHCYASSVTILPDRLVYKSKFFLDGKKVEYGAWEKLIERLKAIEV